MKYIQVHLKYIQSRHKNYGSLNMSQGLGLFMTPSRIQATISAPPCHARRPCKRCESTRRHNTTRVQRKVLMSSPACTACGAWCTCDTKWHEFAFWIFHWVQAPEPIFAIFFCTKLGQSFGKRDRKTANLASISGSLWKTQRILKSLALSS